MKFFFSCLKNNGSLILIFVFIAGIFPLSIKAEDIPEQNIWSLGTSQLRVKGISRTKRPYLDYLINSCQKQFPFSTLQFLNWRQDFAQCLLNSRHFSKVTILEEKTSDLIHLQLEERWTLLPLPFVRMERTGALYGLFVMETHAFGLGKFLGLGLSYGKQRGGSLVLIYKDPSLNWSEWTLNSNLRLSQQQWWTYSTLEKKWGVEEKEKAIELNIGRQINPYLNLSLHFNGQEKSQQSIKDSVEIENNSWVNGQTEKKLFLGPQFLLQKNQFKFYFLQGLSLLGHYQFALDEIKKSHPLKRGFLQGEWQTLLFKDWALQLQGNYQHQNNSPIQEAYREGGKKGQRGIPASGLWVREIHSLALDLQIPLKHKEYGIWTMAPFLDLAQFKLHPEAPDAELNHGQGDSLSFGLGSYLFLKKMALPGLGLIMGKNYPYDSFFVSFFVGRQF